ncbi:MAG: hypothetical protein H7A32_04275 [Deltaproteobacteria bacterium]|nr:hypothetical protein [Deltaproteobacteria bacterium]
MKKRIVRNFDFSKIPKLTRRQVAITQALLERYPQFYDIKNQRIPFVDKLSKELNSPVKISFSMIEEETRARFVEKFSLPCAVAELLVEPFEHKVLLSFDYLLSRYIIQQLLGVQGVEITDQVVFSDTEKGVFEYFLLCLLMSLPDYESPQGEVTIRLSKFSNEAKLFSNDSAEELGIVFKVYLSVGNRGGYINIFVPHPLVEGVLLKSDPVTQDRRGVSDEDFERQLSRVSHVKTSIWSEVGKVGLSLSEIQHLEKGDVILFDESMMRAAHGNISGKAVLRVGDNPSQGGFLTEVIDAEGKLVLKILDYYGGTV